MSSTTTALSTSTTVFRATDYLPQVGRSEIANALSVVALKLNSPFHYSTEKLVDVLCPIPYTGNYPNLIKIQKIFALALSILCTPVSVPLALAAGIIGSAADKISPNPFIYYKGNASEKVSSDLPFKAKTLNICSLFGGLPQAFGGLPPAHKRIDKLCQLIGESDPDVLLLQEASFGPGRALYSKLKDKYAHFYTKIGEIGLNPIALDSGLFIATKLPIISKPRFIPFPNMTWFKRGAFCIETEKLRIYATHLSPGAANTDAAQRKRELECIEGDIKKNSTEKTIIIGGDFNLFYTPLTKREYDDLNISENFFDPYQRKYGDLDRSPDTATFVDVSSTRKNGEKVKLEFLERNDYFLIRQGSQNDLQYEIDLNRGSYSLKPNNGAASSQEPFILDESKGLVTDHRGLLLTIKDAR